MAQTILADLDEILFESRNRAYGAYLLRKNYPQSLFKASMIVGSLFMLMALLPIIREWIWGTENSSSTQEHIIRLEENSVIPQVPDKEEIEVPKLPSIKPPQVNTSVFLLPDPTSEQELESSETDQTILEMDSLMQAPSIGFENIEGNEFGFEEGNIEGENIPEVIVEVREPSPDQFIPVEEEPVPFNMDDIRKQIGYPRPARDAEIQGNVILRILVNEKGEYVKHIVLNSKHPILEKAVVDKIHLLRFTPAIQGGNAIPFWVNVPFAFKLMR